MRLKEKLRAIESKLREMYIDGAKELAQKTQSTSGRFANLYSELLHIHKEMKNMANGDMQKDCNKFDMMAFHCLTSWGKIYNSLANRKVKEYNDIKDVPKNIFRSASPDTTSKVIKFGSRNVKVVPFKSKLVDSEFVYTLDEIDWLKSKKLNEKEVDAISCIKEEFCGSYVETDFDRIMGSTQSKGAVVYEGNRFHKTTGRVFENEFSRELRLPLEEQQRYANRPS